MEEKHAIIINQPLETLEELTILGYRVLETKNCIEGLRLIVRYKPDIVICPLNMPYFTGIAMAEIMELFHINPPMIFTSTDIKDKKLTHGLKNHYPLLLQEEITDYLERTIQKELARPRKQQDRFTYNSFPII